MSKLPFAVFKRKGRRFYYVKFKNSSGEFLSMISTGKETEAEALEVSFRWYREGVPSKKIFKGLGLLELIQRTKSVKEVEFLCEELKKKGLLSYYAVSDSTQAMDFISYLETFWDWDLSPYVESRLRKEHGIHKRYVLENKQNVLKYWKPFFAGKLLGSITEKDIDSLMRNLDKLSNTKNGKLSPARKNKIIRSGTIALQWAFSKKDINHDPTQGITWFAGKSKNRCILTPELTKALFMVEWKDERAKLGNMLAMCTGLRAGEVLGLRPCDFGDECIYIKNSWSSVDKLKTTKTNEPRVVELPFPQLITRLLQLSQHSPHQRALDGFVFWAEKLAGKPMEGRLLVKGLREALVLVGMSSTEARKYDFHCWRHFFTAYMKPKLDGKLLKLQTGHRTEGMLDHYGNHVLEGERDQIRLVQKEVFGEFIYSLPTNKS